MTVAAAVSALAERCPWDPQPDPDLDRALAFLGWPVEAAAVQRAGDLAGTAVACAVVAVGALVVGPGAATLMLAGLAGVAVSAGARTAPHLLATARRTRALGAAPGLVSRAVLRMRLSPTPETAAAFAAETGRGRLADSLADHVARASGAGRSGLQAFADEWAEWFPALRRALTLVESAGRAPPEERARALDTALEATLEGARETMAEFAASVRGPATAIYAFGVLLPLALVAMLPAAGTIGLAVPLRTVVFVYDVCLPLALVAASAWLLSRRPVAFPPPGVSRRHPAVPDRRLAALVGGVVAGVVAALATVNYVAGWAAPLGGVGVGLGVALVVAYRPMAAVRAEVRAIEDGLADALYLVGREVQRGRAVETAMAEAAATVDGPTGDLLADATRQQRQLRVGVRESLLGDRGVLRTVPSERVESSAELLAIAASAGRPAGQAVVSLAAHVDDLGSAEREIRRTLQQVTGTLAHTAAVFGPLVGGATITLAERLSVGGPLAGDTSISSGALGLAVGAYVLVLSVVLTALATGLERGLDRSLLGYRVGRALLSATATFLLALVGTRLLV